MLFRKITKKPHKLQTCLIAGIIIFFNGCGIEPQVRDVATTTPTFYQEDKVFFLKQLDEDVRFSAEYRELAHMYEVDPRERRDHMIKHNNPISVVLQGVRIPEDATPTGTRDIAVILDIVTGTDRGMTTLVAFYQRNVPGGQMLNFNNLLVYADPMWDSATPPRFRIRVIDVRDERNTRTGELLSGVSNISNQIGGLVPHPVIPIVSEAIKVAGLVLSNQQNQVLLDFDVQFYGDIQLAAAGDATLGPLLAGQWLVVGRRKGADSTFWKTNLFLERRTDRIVGKRLSSNTKTEAAEYMNISVPYVTIVLLKADTQVPQLVLDRSASLLQLISSPAGKSDVDALTEVADGLISAVSAFTLERRLRRYRSKMDLQEMIDRIKEHRQAQVDGEPDGLLNDHELRRLIYVIGAITTRNISFATAKEIVDWWDGGGDKGRFVDATDRPFGIEWRTE